MSLHRAALVALLLACTLSPMFSGADAQVSCTWPFNNATLSFTYCANLTGEYMLYWNASASSITVGFSKMHDGYIAWGISPLGGMVGSSAIIGYNDAGVAKVDSYFLGGKNPALVVPPGKFAAGAPTTMKVEYVGGYIRTLTTLPIAPSTTSISIIWAYGAYSTGLKKHTEHSDATLNVAAGTVSGMDGSTPAPTLGTAAPPQGNTSVTAPSPASAPSASHKLSASACLTALLLVFTFALV